MTPRNGRTRAEADGLRWLQTRCLSYGAGLAYWPYTDLLRTVAGIDPQTAAEEAHDVWGAKIRFHL